MKIQIKATNAYQITFSASTPEYVSGTVLIDAFGGNLLKELVQKLGIQVDSSIVQSATANKSQDPSKLTGTGKDDLGINRTFGITQRSDGTYMLADYSRGKELKHILQIIKIIIIIEEMYGVIWMI